ncbi:MDR family MFS transporter [Streptacidiphilus cavernicola]|uniref:MDR family MFS transporter n=1 Tax=Streptacidiphilus cavernicola TaxID=3342716 RepID=A0ABV6W3C6_9ACTN
MSTPHPPPPKALRWTMLGIMLAMLLGMLDNMVVGTAMPTIVGELGGLNHLSWVVTAYTLATAASTPVWGKLGDLYGRKGTFLVSIVIFLAGSGLSGAAQDMNQLIAFRALQGLGAGGLAVGAFALIGALVAPRERGRYQSMTAAVMAVGTIGGPLLGGFVTGHLGWRWCFYVNLPIGILVLVWMQLVLRLPKQRSTARIDYPGAALLAATITALTLVTTWGGGQYAWGSVQIAGLLALAAAGLAGFLWWQTRAPEPLLPLGIFRSRNLRLASVMMFVIGAAMFGATLYLPMFQQSVQGVSASDSGLLLLPMVLPMLVFSQIAGRVMTRTGRYRIFPILGTALVSAGFALLSTMGAGTGRLESSLFMAVLGTGLGLAMQMPMTIAQNSVELKHMGVASAASTLFRTLGGSLGVALFGSLFSRHVHQGVQTAHAVAAGTQQLFLWGAVISLAAVVAAWFVTEVPLRGKPGSAPAPAGPGRSDTPEPAAAPAR